ncbi:MAG: GspH/FimT family pseudopilin [Woeseiaceae bacterium]
MWKGSRGFSLYELLVTLLIAALVMTIGLPAFSGTVARHRQRVEIDALFHAVHLARKESILRRRVVSLCPSLDGRQCSASRDWSSGWLMFENSDRDVPPHVDPGEPLLQRHTVDPTVRISANRQGFTLRATVQRATTGTFVVCDREQRVQPRGLVISYTGRPRVARQTRAGKPYECAD